MRRTIGACLLVSLLALAASATAANAPVPVYLETGSGPDKVIGAGGEFAVASNDDWKLRLKVPTPAKEIRPQWTRKAQPNQTGPFERQDLAYVWAPTCTAERQTVTFIRDVVLPGPPGEVSFEVDQLSYGGAVEEATLFVNGHKAFTLGRGLPRVEHDKKVVGLFGYGQTHLAVEITKRAGAKPCNTGRPETDFGVRFRVAGVFVADVAVRTDLPAKEAMRASNPQGINGTIEIFNNGPSGVYSGQFRLLINVASIEQVIFRDGPDVSGPGVTDCKSSVPAGSLAPRTKPIEITCKLRNMPPGTKAAVKFRLAASFNTSAFYAAISYAREVFASADDPKNNNTLSNTILLCHESNESPDCANAK
jgi:hypothetical protein